MRHNYSLSVCLCFAYAVFCFRFRYAATSWLATDNNIVDVNSTIKCRFLWSTTLSTTTHIRGARGSTEAQHKNIYFWLKKSVKMDIKRERDITRRIMLMAQCWHAISNAIVDRERDVVLYASLLFCQQNISDVEMFCRHAQHSASAFVCFLCVYVLASYTIQQILYTKHSNASLRTRVADVCVCVCVFTQRKIHAKCFQH